MDTDALGHYKNALADSMGSLKQTSKGRHFVSHTSGRSACRVVLADSRILTTVDREAINI